MKKRGISLIVLVITIVVVVILALAVILSITNNNLIENAKKAAFLNDMAVIKDEFSIYLHKKMIETNGEFDVTELEKMNIQEIIPSLSGKYANKIEIKNGQLQYVDTDNIQEYIWAKESFEGGTSNIDIAKKEDSTVEISNATEGKLENLKIYGNSVQNVSVGDKVKNYLPNEIYDLNNWTKSGTSYKYYIKNLPKDAENITISFKHKLCENVGGYTQDLGYFYLQSSEDNGANYTNIFQFIMGKTIKGFSYTVPNDGKDYALYWYGESDLFKNIENIQIEEGTSATEYESYDADHLGKYKIPITVRGKNLFNYTEAINSTEQGFVDEDGWITLSIDNTSGTSTKYLNFWTKVNNNLKPNTKYYVYVDVAKKEGNITHTAVSTAVSNESQFVNGNVKESGYVTTVSDFSIAKTMLRSFASCKAGEKGSVKFRIAVYEVKQDSFEPYYNEKYDIYLDEPLRKVENAVDYIDFKRGKVIRKVGTEKTESIVLPDVFTKNGNNIIEVGTSVAPSNIEVIYNKEK